jgi:hypothetical protein
MQWTTGVVPLYSETMHLWEKNTRIVANFTTNFSLIISSEGADRYSDGLTFFLAPISHHLNQQMALASAL